MFRSALHQDPAPLDIASIFVHMASCHKDLGEYRDALKALDTAEEHNPELKEIYNLRGFATIGSKSTRRPSRPSSGPSKSIRVPESTMPISGPT